MDLFSLMRLDGTIAGTVTPADVSVFKSINAKNNLGLDCSIGFQQADVEKAIALAKKKGVSRDEIAQLYYLLRSFMCLDANGDGVLCKGDRGALLARRSPLMGLSQKA